MQSGIEVPQLHCAFRGCDFVSSLKQTEDPLAQHVYEAHLSYRDSGRCRNSAPAWREIANGIAIKAEEVDEEWPLLNF